MNIEKRINKKEDINYTTLSFKIITRMSMNMEQDVMEGIIH